MLLANIQRLFSAKCVSGTESMQVDKVDIGLNP